VFDVIMSTVLVKDIMIKDIYTIGPEEKIALARLKMLRFGVGGLPVVKDNDILEGMLTLRDISIAGIDTGNLLVKNLMTKENLIVGTEETTLIEVTDMIIETGIQRIPIVNNEGRLVGLMTQSVLIRAFRNLFK
jgi:IMP dehydrogenase